MRNPISASYVRYLDTVTRALGFHARECAHVEKLISLMADGMATEAEKHQIDAHCPTCANCRALQATTLIARIELRERPVVVVPHGLADRLQAAMRQERLRELANQRRRAEVLGPQLRLGIGGAAAAIIVTAVFLVHGGLHQKQPLVRTNQNPTVTIAQLPPRSVPFVPKAAKSHVPEIIASVPPLTHDQSLPPAMNQSRIQAPDIDRVVTPSKTSVARAVVASLPKNSDRPFSSDTLTTPKPEAVHVAMLPPHSQFKPSNAVPSPDENAPQETPTETPVVVAELPPDQRSGQGNPAITIASDDSAHVTPLNGMLRNLVRRSQTQQVADAKISLASMVLKPSYDDTVPMVSAPVR